MNRTSIEWCDFTWNPVTGCLGPGGTPDKPNRCPYCYAHRLANGRLKPLYLSNPNVAPGCDPDDPFSPRFWPDRLKQPLKRKKPAKIFVVDMGDLFHDIISTAWVWSIRHYIAEAQQHTYLLLTKNPSKYRLYRPWPHNYWLGITVTNQADWDERWPILAQVKAAVKFVSFEPFLSKTAMRGTGSDGPLPDWIIIGAQTKPDKQPSKAAMSYLVWQAEFSNIPMFLKDNLDCEAMGIQRRQEWPK